MEYGKKLNFLKQLDCIIATLLVLAGFVNILLQVIGRLTPGRVVPWTVEMGEILLVAIIWMGIGLGVQNNTHIRFDLILGKLPHKAKKIFFVVGNVIFAMFLIFLAYYTIDLLAFHLRVGNRTPMLGWSRALIRAPVLIGCILGALRLLIQAWFFATEKIPLPATEVENEAAESLAKTKTCDNLEVKK